MPRPSIKPIDYQNNVTNRLVDRGMPRPNAFNLRIDKECRDIALRCYRLRSRELQRIHREAMSLQIPETSLS